MSTALIIGASRGIGREFADQLLERGWNVVTTARSDEDIASLQTAGAHAIKLDVAAPDSLAALQRQLDGTRLDLAIYVAGIYGPRRGAGTPPSAAEFDAVMHTNVRGAMQTIPMIAPLVEAARGRFVFIGSIMGSIGSAGSSEGWLYRTSKAALNMAVKAASFDYPKATFVTMHPGWVRTDMGGSDASISVEESIDGMLDTIDRLTLKDSGTYHDHAGKRLPW